MPNRSKQGGKGKKSRRVSGLGVKRVRGKASKPRGMIGSSRMFPGSWWQGHDFLGGR